MKKIDYQKKAELLSDKDFMQQVRDIKRAETAHVYLMENGCLVYSKIDYDTSQDMRCFFSTTRPEDLTEAEKIIKAEYNRVTRLRSRIRLFLDCKEPTNFITLTFSDKILQNSTPKDRRRYVQRYLKSQSNYFIANVDYGEKKGREHYHAVILGKIDLEPWRKYGHILSEKVGNRKELTRKNVPKRYRHLDEKTQKSLMLADTEKKISKYVAKLTNHAIKETTKRSVMIYSKQMPNPFPELEKITDKKLLQKMALQGF